MGAVDPAQRRTRKKADEDRGKVALADCMDTLLQVTFGRGVTHSIPEDPMNRGLGVLLAVLLLPSCRTYDYYSRVSDETGYVSGDQYARYGREQAQSVAIARRLAESREDGLEAAVTYARSLPDVVNVVADPQGNWLTLSFKSGWRVAVTPLADGKSATETPNLPAAATPAPAR
jgi:hypothetical protein